MNATGFTYVDIDDDSPQKAVASPGIEVLSGSPASGAALARTPGMTFSTYVEAYKERNRGKEPIFVPFTTGLVTSRSPYDDACAINLSQDSAVFLCRSPEDAQAISRGTGKPVLICDEERKYRATVQYLVKAMPDKKIYSFDQRGVKNPVKGVRSITPPFSRTELKQGLTSYSDFARGRDQQRLGLALSSQLGPAVARDCPALNQSRQQGIRR